MAVRTSPSISVIIVSYNTREMTLECLAKLYSDLDGIDAEVWVVDNASSDGSVAAIRESYPQVRMIANDENTGFGRANNQAMLQALGEMILLLNSDAFPEGAAIRKLIDYLKENPRVAAVGPVLLNTDRSFQESILSYPSLMHVLKNRLWINAMRRRFLSHKERELTNLVLDSSQYLCGACMLVRRTCYESVGGFDEAFFFYGEDADWQQRMQLAGWQLARISDARVVHRHGSSGGGDRLRFTVYYFESEERFVRKYQGRLAALCVRIATAINSSVQFVRHAYRIPMKWMSAGTEDFPARIAWRLLIHQFQRRTVPPHGKDV